MKIARQISTGNILYRESPDFEAGKGILNARFLFSEIPENDMEEVELNITEQEYQSMLLTLDEKKIAVKALCRTKILAFISEWQQANYTARHSELIRICCKDDIPLTQSEEDEMAMMQGIWDRVKALRAASNDIEAEIDTDANYDYNNSPLWPE